MNAKQWRLSRRAISILASDPGLTEHSLAERLAISAAELHPVVGMLLGRGQLERCGEYLVLTASSGATGSAE